MSRSHHVTLILVGLLVFAGNIIGTPTVRADGEPVSVITGKPSALSNDPMPEFTFVADVPGSTFECWLDTQPAVSCTSPFVVPEPLTEGEHTFNVRAAAPGSEIFNSSATVYPWTFAWDANAVTDIHSCVELQQIGYDFNYSPDSDYRLAHDIDCSDTVNWNEGEGWVPLASFGDKFSGVFDGNNKQITDLFLNRNPASSPGLGLFSHTENATIKDLIISGSVTNSTEEFGTCSGALAGAAFGSVTIDNVTSTVSVSGLQDGIGGFVGCLIDGTGTTAITDSSVDATLSLGAIGGLIGSADISDAASVTVTNTQSAGDFSGTTVGGLFGSFIYRSWDSVTPGPALTITNSGSSANISATTAAGGFIHTLNLFHRGADISGASFTGTIDAAAGIGVAGMINSLSSFNDEASETTISQSYVSGSLTSNSNDVGGLVGVLDANHTLTIDQSYFGGIIDAVGDRVGGLIGNSAGATTITNSYVDAQLDGDQYVGGLVGVGTADISDSFAVGSIASTASVLGGLVGSLANGSITNSFAAVSIASTFPTTVGGLVGGISASTITNSYVDIGLSTQGCNSTSDPENPSTIDCQTIDSSGEDINYFVNNSSNAPHNQWDFETIWQTNEYFYPCLQWQDNCQTFEPQVVCEQPTATSTTIHGRCDIQVRSGFNYGTTTWEVRYKKASDGSYQTVNLDDPTFPDVTIDGLIPETGYFIEFRFTNNWGTGEWARLEFLTTTNPEIEIDMSSAEDSSVINFIATGCESLGEWRTLSEAALPTSDPAYNYSKGLIKFNLADCPIGGTAVVRLTFETPLDFRSVVLRKYNENLGSYTTLTEANSSLQITATTVGGKPAVVAQYSITDGGVFDQDGTVNGQIQDPIGLASLVVGVPNTGFGGRL